MSPSTLYEQEGASWLSRLHEATGINRQYLYQCATGRRRPSPEYAKRMVSADLRLTLDGIYADEKVDAGETVGLVEKIKANQRNFGELPDGSPDPDKHRGAGDRPAEIEREAA